MNSTIKPNKTISGLISNNKTRRSRIRSKEREKKRSIRFRRKPLPGLQDGHYDNTNIVRREPQIKGILKKKNKPSEKVRNGAK